MSRPAATRYEAPPEPLQFQLRADVVPVIGLLSLMPTDIEPTRRDEAVLFMAKGQYDALIVASVIYDTRRRRPLVVYTPRANNGWFDGQPKHVAAKLWDDADVVMMEDPTTTAAFNTLVPSWLQTYNGSIRVFAPGADRCDEADVHPWVKPTWERNKDGIHTKIISLAKRVARNRRNHDVEYRFTELQRKHAETLAELAETRTKLSNARPVEREVDTTQPVVFNDPEMQFDHELYCTWLACTPDGDDRQRWPLRTYGVGEKFIESMQDMKIVSRAAILRACVDVVTGRYAEINGRQAKHLNKPGARGRIERPEDGAIAWRCSIASGTPGAPRLMWWECDEDTPELSLVAHHDDFRIAP
jgi:hypothetical protein